jgi:hypothetical protein
MSLSLEEIKLANQIKGEILGYTTQIEKYMEFLIIEMYEKNINNSKEKITNYLKEKSYQKNSITKIFQNKNFTIFEKQNLLFKILKIHKKTKAHNIHKNVLKLIKIRNDIAHNKEEYIKHINKLGIKSSEEEGKYILLDNKFGKEITTIIKLILFDFMHIRLELDLPQYKNNKEIFISIALKNIDELEQRYKGKLKYST